MADVASPADDAVDTSGRDRWLQKGAVDPAGRFPVLVEALAAAADLWTESFCAIAGTEGAIAFGGLRAIKVGDLPHRRVGGLPIFAALRVSAWDATLGLGLDRVAVSTIVEAFFGGGGEDQERAGGDRPVSPIEMRIVDVVGGQAAAALTGALRAVLPIKIDFERTLPKPEAAFLGKPPTALLMAQFQLTTIGRTVPIDLLLPQAALDAQGGLFAGDDAPVVALDEAGWARQMQSEVSRATVRLEAAVALSSMTLKGIAELRLGQVLELPPDTGASVILRCGDEHLFRCALGQSSGCYTVRIEEALERTAQSSRKGRALSL